MIRAYDDNGNVVDLVAWEKQIRADVLDEFAKLIHHNLYQLNHHQVDFLAEQLKIEDNNE